MECPNCAFQNTPGSRVCVRCRSLVDFANTDVLPPRAAQGRARRRVRSAAAGAHFAVRDWLASLRMSLRIPVDLRVSWGDLALCILPGLDQIRRRQRALGWTILGAWLFLLLAGAVGFASGWAV